LAEQGDGFLAGLALGGGILGGLHPAEMQADEFLAERRGRLGLGQAGLQDADDLLGVAVAGGGGRELEPAQGPGRELARHLAEQLAHPLLVAGGAIEGGQPDQRAFGRGLAGHEILDGAQGLLGLALEHQSGGHAQDEPLVGGIDLGGLAVGVVGQIVLVGEFVVDADGIPGMGLGRALAVLGKQRGRNEPSVQHGRRAWQRSATGRDANPDEAERKPTPARAAHGAVPSYFFL
jgi:hypothetical protein